MSVEIELQIASNTKTLPHPNQFKDWVSKALDNRIENGEITIRVVDVEEMSALNFSYRNKNGPTNVLSFPYDVPSYMDVDLIGDIIICAPVVQEEADRYNVQFLAHWAHMVVHGTLHLLGYDHELDEEAALMEGLETSILQQFGFKNPYENGGKYDLT
ncbi:MAG: rRNA maturation RNase YbeY [Gammaproteobacteria bacterium]